MTPTTKTRFPLVVAAALALHGCGDKRDGTDSTDSTDSTDGTSRDADLDGYTTVVGDCDDTDASASPGASETWDDGIEGVCPSPALPLEKDAPDPMHPSA